VLDETAVTIGHATNNVAEYRGLLLGLERAAALGATEIEVVNDSELVARQVEGGYKVKHADLKPLHAQAKKALEAFEGWSIRSVPRPRTPPPTRSSTARWTARRSRPARRCPRR
jgi:ribonuclease HI